MNPQTRMKSIDVDVNTILVRFRLGLHKHMCRDTTLRWEGGAFFDSFGNRFLGHHRKGFFARRRWDLVFGPHVLKRGQILVGFYLYSAGLLRNISHTLLDFLHL